VVSFYPRCFATFVLGSEKPKAVSAAGPHFVL
jgi:hypothetical protein